MNLDAALDTLETTLEEAAHARAMVESLDERRKQILAAMVGLAEVLGATVVVEGVESETQLRIVQQAGHCEVQGFLYSPAVGPDLYEDMLRTQPWMRADA